MLDFVIILMNRKRPTEEYPCTGPRKYCSCREFFVYTNIAKLRKHQSSCQLHKELYNCSKCNVEFQDEDDLEEHWGTDEHYYFKAPEGDEINSAEDIDDHRDHNGEIEEGKHFHLL